MIKLLTPKNRSVISFFQDEHLKYLNDRRLLSSTASMCSANDASFPRPTVFSFEPRLNADVLITDSHGRTVTFKAVNGRAEVYNLLIGEKYTWRVKSGFMTSEVFCFYTDATPPRLLRIDGISNVRDIGGFNTTDNKKTRQAMLYRSSEIDRRFSLTDNGARTLTDFLKIRTELDLRGANGEPVGTTLTGGRINYFNFPLKAYGEIFEQSQMLLYRKSFALLSDKATYPVLVHCQSGADRTGSWLFILGALLGTDEGELMLDYEMSSFSECGMRSRESEDFSVFLRKLHSYGKDVKAAAEGFLLSCGLSEAEISKIRELLTVDE